MRDARYQTAGFAVGLDRLIVSAIASVLVRCHDKNFLSLPWRCSNGIKWLREYRNMFYEFADGAKIDSDDLSLALVLTAF